jgi:hypothetical protein
LTFFYNKKTYFFSEAKSMQDHLRSEPRGKQEGNGLGHRGEENRKGTKGRRIQKEGYIIEKNKSTR